MNPSVSRQSNRGTAMTKNIRTWVRRRYSMLWCLGHPVADKTPSLHAAARAAFRTVIVAEQELKGEVL
jgi:hypothetical protein